MLDLVFSQSLRPTDLHRLHNVTYLSAIKTFLFRRLSEPALHISSGWSEVSSPPRTCRLTVAESTQVRTYFVQGV